MLAVDIVYANAPVVLAGLAGFFVGAGGATIASVRRCPVRGGRR